MVVPGVLTLDLSSTVSAICDNHNNVIITLCPTFWSKTSDIGVKTSDIGVKTSDMSGCPTVFQKH